MPAEVCTSNDASPTELEKMPGQLVSGVFVVNGYVTKPWPTYGIRDSAYGTGGQMRHASFAEYMAGDFAVAGDRYSQGQDGPPGMHHCPCWSKHPRPGE